MTGRSMRKKRRRTQSPEWKKVTKLIGDLKATKRLIRYAKKMEAPEPGQTLAIAYLKMLGIRISNEATAALMGWDQARKNKERT